MRQPSLLVPYPGPDVSVGTYDVFMYLRPETNGVLTESVIMKTITSDPVWKEKVRLVYLANYPGDFIHTRHLIEHHYRLKIVFARQGGNAFTPGMRTDFRKKFQCDFKADQVIGAFEALRHFNMNEEQLFKYRVDEKNMLITLGQNIKRYRDNWIVNYDIPAILHSNTFETDIAVMVFRVKLSWMEFLNLVSAMSFRLVDAGVLGPDTPPSRAFHYSRSPWEQLLDGVEYLWGVDVSDGGAEDNISFGAFMMEKGYSRQFLREIIRHPLIIHRDSSGVEREVNIFELSTGMDYPGAADILNQVKCHIDIPG